MRVKSSYGDVSDVEWMCADETEITYVHIVFCQLVVEVLDPEPGAVAVSCVNLSCAMRSVCAYLSAARPAGARLS